MSSERALRRAHVPSVVPLLNPLVRRLVGAGLPFGPNVLLTVHGRSSGLPRTFPVALLEAGGRRYVQSPFGEVNWVRNLRASPHATMTRGRHREQVEAVELTLDEAASALQSALSPYARSRITNALIGLFFHVRPDASLEDFVAEAAGHPTFELRPAP